jgi:hypothetical protein
MSTLRSIASTQPEEVAVSVARVSRQIAICVLLTALNVAVAALFGGTLYSASAGRPFLTAAVTLLFAALFGSLVRVWVVALRRP